MGGAGKEDAWPVMDVKPFERMRVGKKEREEQQIGILLGPKKEFDLLDEFDVDHEDVGTRRGAGGSSTVRSTTTTTTTATGQEDQQGKIDDLQSEVTRLQDQLRRAKEINDEMWKGVVKRSFDVDGDDVEME
jgi:pre-rRNA-processing protein IPI3